MDKTCVRSTDKLKSVGDMATMLAVTEQMTQFKGIAYKNAI